MIFSLLFSLVLSFSCILLVFYIYNRFLNDYQAEKKRITSGMLYSVLIAILTSLVSSLVASIPYTFLAENFELLATIFLLIIVSFVEQLLIRNFCALKAGPQLEYKNVGAFALGYAGLTPLISAAITAVLNLLAYSGVDMEFFTSAFSNIPIFIQNNDIMLSLRFFVSSFASFVIMNLVILLLMYGLKKRNKAIFVISLSLEVVFSLLAYINNNSLMVVFYLIIIYVLVKIIYPRLKNTYISE